MYMFFEAPNLDMHKVPSSSIGVSKDSYFPGMYPGCLEDQYTGLGAQTLALT